MPTDWGGGAGADIGRTLVELGRIRGENMVQQGNIWGHAIANIGNTIEQAPVRQMQQQEIAARTAELQGLAQDRQLKAAALLREQQGTQVLAQAIGDPANHGDPESIYQAVSTAGFPEHAQKYLKNATDHAEALGKITARRREDDQTVADVLSSVDPSDTVGLTSVVGLLQKHGIDMAPYSEVLDASTKATGSAADGIKHIVDSAPENVKAKRAADLKRNEALTTPVKLGPDESLVMPGQNGSPATTIAKGLPKERVPAAAGSFEDYVTRYAQNKGKPVEALTTADIEDARKRYQQADDRPPSVTVNTGNTNDVKETIAGMKDGSLPPIMPGRASKEYTALLAEAHRQGYDLAGAATDWAATQKHIATLNGAQQTRLNQSVNALPELLDSVDTLASQWKGGRFPPLNRANLTLAKNGAYGETVASVARQLDSQIADVTADLGNVYMGGNSPTDQALELAGKSLGSDWSEKVLHDMVTLARRNVQIRKNSIRNTGVQGASAGNPYAPQQSATAASGTTPAPAPRSGPTLTYQDYMKAKGGK